MEMDGNPLSSIKNKRDISRKIACHMRNLKLEGWKHMDYYHLVAIDYQMFQSLENMVKHELKK
jgi:hypothetical protein